VATGFVTTYLTECVGLSVACLALAYLLRGSHDQNVPSRMLGYGILGLGWLIRPGPMGLLALPAVLEWTLRGPRRAARGLLAVALVLGALVAGKAAFALVATPNATENANAALTIYGLALGEAWNVAEAKFYADDATRRTLDTSERVTLQYKLAKAAFLNDPKPALAKCAQNLVEGTRALTVHLPAQLWLQRKQSTQLSHDCAFLLLLPGSIVALGFLFRRSRSVSLLLGGACLAGLASLPLIWADGTWRGVVLVLPFMIVFHSLAFSLRHLRAAPSNSEGSPPDCPEAISLYAATAATSLLLSLGVLAFVFPNADVQPVINVERDACVFLGETSSAPRLLGAPVIATAEAADSIRAAGMDLYDLDAVIEGIKTPALLCARPTGGSPSWLIVEGATPRTVGRLAVDTMAPHENRYFSVATHWHWLDPQE
jgi:hypothetical protein